MHAKGGKIDWSAFSDQDIQIISPGEVYQVEVETTTLFDGHYVLVSNQGDDGVGEVRITIEYVDVVCESAHSRLYRLVVLVNEGLKYVHY